MQQVQKPLILSNGLKIRSLNHLHNSLDKINEKIFYKHVNENKNDFYNWAKDVLKDNALAEDLLECTTKEAVKFCLASKLESQQNIDVLEQLPKGYDRENDIFEDLPKGYHPKLGARDVGSAKTQEPISKATIKTLVTLIKKQKTKNNTLSGSKSKRKTIATNFEPKKLKEVKINNVETIIQHIKEVYNIE